MDADRVAPYNGYQWPYGIRWRGVNVNESARGQKNKRKKRRGAPKHERDEVQAETRMVAWILISPASCLDLKPTRGATPELRVRLRTKTTPKSPSLTSPSGRRVAPDSRHA
jgi:hypothetical protein